MAWNCSYVNSDRKFPNNPFAGSSEKPIANGDEFAKVRSGSYHDSIGSKMNGGS